MGRKKKTYDEPIKGITQLMDIYIYDETPTDIDIIPCLKEIIRKLEPAEQQIILSYADTGSLRHLAKHLNCSYSRINKTIKQIQTKIIWQLKFYT